MRLLAFFVTSICACQAAELVSTVARTPTAEDFASTWGVAESAHRWRFGKDGFLEVDQIAGTPKANIVHEGERCTVTVQLRNGGGKPLAVEGRWVLVAYSLTTPTQDVFKVALSKGAELPFGKLQVPLDRGAFTDLEVAVPLP